MTAGRHRPKRWWAYYPRTAAASAMAALAAVVIVIGAWVAPHPAVATGSRSATPTTSSSATPTTTTSAPATTTPATTTPAATTPAAVPTASRRPPPAPASKPAQVQTPRPEPAPAATAKPEPAPPAVAVELLALVNRDRTANGCAPVTLNQSIDQQSQAWSQQQAADGYMHHSSGVAGFGTWGENVAYGYDTVAQVHAAWMGSPPHRENILNCAYTLFGAGVADGGNVRYWTEQFAR